MKRVISIALALTLMGTSVAAAHGYQGGGYRDRYNGYSAPYRGGYGYRDHDNNAAAAVGVGGASRRRRGLGLVLRSARRMVGYHHVQRAVQEAVPQRLTVGAVTNGRAGRELGCTVGNILGRKGEVVRAGLRADRQADVLCRRNDRQFESGRHGLSVD